MDDDPGSTGRLDALEPGLSPEKFGLKMGDFDFDAAFQGAMEHVATDEELALDEKVRRMEAIVSEGTSEVYREFVDFRAMAAQMEIICNHNQALGEALRSNSLLAGLMDSHKPGDGHGHTEDSPAKHDHDDETDPKIGKKKKKKRGWFDV